MLCYVMLCHVMLCYSVIYYNYIYFDSSIFFCFSHFNIFYHNILNDNFSVQFGVAYVPPTPLFNTDTNSECRSKILKCPTPACNKCTGISLEGTLGQNSRNVTLC